MLKKKAVLFLILYLSIAGLSYAQTSVATAAPVTPLELLQTGIVLFSQGRWQGAITVLSLIDETSSSELRAEALFWSAQAKILGGDYEGALQDMENLEFIDPGNNRIGELAYHRGRALYNLGRYDEAIILLSDYADMFASDNLLSSEDLLKKAAAFFWIGECLYSVGHFDRAEDIFFIITNNYPQSAKYEAAVYRLALINQKKIEAELLALLNWNHQESLLIMEEYQRRERAYDQAILSYQRRIAEMSSDTRMADLEEANVNYQQELAYAESRIRELEARLAETPQQRMPSESIDRLNNLRNSAIQMQEEIQRIMGAGM